MEYLPHQQRVIEECNELDIRLSKLNSFIGSRNFGDVIGPERAMLTAQAHHMTGYWMTLRERIELWKSHEPVPVVPDA